MRKLSGLIAALFIFSFISVPAPANAEVPAKISTANYPVGMDEDSNGNIFIASEVNENAGKIGLLVVPKNTGTLFGQSVTAGVEFLLFNRAGVKGVAVDANNDLIISVDGGKIYALTSTARTVYGISVPANTVTELFGSSKFNGPLQFDSTGNLFGIDASRNQISALVTTPKTLFGVSVTANTPTVISTITNGWFWDLSVDLADNILISYGFTDNAGVWMLPKATGTSYGQAVTANLFVKLNVFAPYLASGTAGMDVDSSGNVFVATWSDSVSVYTPNGFTRFGQNFTAGSVTKIIRTKYGRTNQGVAVLADGSLITGGGNDVFLIKDNSTEPAVQPLSLANSDLLLESGYVNESNQSYASWGVVNRDNSTITKFNQQIVDGAEGGGFDAVTNKTWLMRKDCKFYSLDQNDLVAPVLEYTFATGYGTECWGFASRNDGTALITTDGVSNQSKLFVVDLATGSKVSADPLNNLLLQDDCLAIALKSNGEIWVSSNQSWNLHKVNPSDGTFTDSIPFWDRAFAGITSMDFDSNDNLIGVYFGLSEGTVSINMSAADPMATAVLNETTDRYGWTSHAIWIRKNYLASEPTSSPAPTQSATPTPSVSVDSSSVESLAQTTKQIIPKFRFAKGASNISAKVKNALRSAKSTYLNSEKITIVASAGLLNGLPAKYARNFAQKRADVLKAFLVSLGVPLARIEIQLNVVKIGIIPKTDLLVTP